MFSLKGRRDTMEDKSASLQFKRKDGELVYIFAVWDGHGGINVAEYASKHFPQIVAQQLDTVADVAVSCDIKKALVKAHEKFEVKLKKHLKEKAKTTGCTSCMVVVFGERRDLYCCNVGDSRAVAFAYSKNKDVQICPMSTDHKPDDPTEKERLAKQGAVVESKDTPRVVYGNTALSMSRGFGDHEGEPFISHEPEVFHHHVDVLEKWQERLQYIMVDEFQDSNSKELALIDFLSRKNKSKL